jgi:prepilin-type N-terminal cleavage/methylation domain-containing protein
MQAPTPVSVQGLASVGLHHAEEKRWRVRRPDAVTKERYGYLPIVRNPTAGFTIIETTVTLSVIAILAAVVLPKASGFIDSIEVRGAVTEAEALFSTARHVAIARGAQTTLEINAGRGEMSLRVARDTLQVRELERAHGVSLRTTRASIVYSPTGVGYGAANLTLIITRNLAADTIFVSRLGRVRH